MRLGLIGFGNIGAALVDLIGRGGPPLDVLTVLVRPGREGAVRDALASGPSGGTVRVVTDCAALLAEAPDLVVECAGHQAVAAFVPDLLAAGRDVVVVSVGALADGALHATLKSAAERGHARLVLPAGAIGGLDLLAALRPAGDLSVSYRGTKPPAAWAGSAAETVLDLARLDRAETFFTGTAREAARAYPKNANVAAALALAGAGFDATRVDLVADPAAPGNVHAYEVVSPVTTFTMRIENRAAPGTARTSLATVYSVLREIRNRVGPVAV